MNFLDSIPYRAMCRLLAVRSERLIDPTHHLMNLAQVARESKVFQGHGWGCAYLKDGEWMIYKNIKPIWEDDLTIFPKTTLLLAHARSAFRDEGIRVGNNMPFSADGFTFIFNGELHGVRIKEEGRIGAEKLFNYIKRLNKGDLAEAMRRAGEVIRRRSRFVRAMNIIISDRKRIYLHSFFQDDPEYFTMHLKEEEGELIICSEPYLNDKGWEKIENGTVRVFG